MANYGVIRTDLVKATKSGNILSGRFYNGFNVIPLLKMVILLNWTV